MTRAIRATAQANLRMIRVSPQKLNLVAARIRGMSTTAALNYLSVCPKRAAVDVRKAVMSAVANAENNHGMDASNLEIVESFVGKGATLKRFRARAKGRGARICKVFSHLCIRVAEKERAPRKSARSGETVSAEAAVEAGSEKMESVEKKEEE